MIDKDNREIGDIDHNRRKGKIHNEVIAHKPKAFYQSGIIFNDATEFKRLPSFRGKGFLNKEKRS